MKILPYLSFIFLMISCKKESTMDGDELPDETHIGKGTMEFTANGKTYAASTSYSLGFIASGNIVSQSYQFYDNTYHFTIGAEKRDSWKWSLLIIADSMQLKEGLKIPLNQASDSKIIANFMDDDGNLYNMLQGVEGHNFLEITHFDEIRAELSGTFEFDAAGSNNKRIQMRQGRFDIVYYR